MKVFKFAMLAMLTLCMFSCHMATPNADQETVLVYKPWFFGHGGVDATPVVTGATICALTTSGFDFNITPQSIQADQENVMTADNTPLTITSIITYKIRKGSTPVLYQNFGEKWFENSLSPMFYSMIRNMCSGYKMFELASDRNILTKLQQNLFGETKRYVDSLKLPIDIIQVTLGRITPPQEVLDETKKTAAQNQAILTQNSRSNMEESRKVADINKAIADQAYQRQMGMSIEQYLNLRHLEIEKEKVELIKDNKNISIIFGNANPVFPVR